MAIEDDIHGEDMRNEALRLAVTSMENGTNSNDLTTGTTNAIVERAAIFYEYMVLGLKYDNVS